MRVCLILTGLVLVIGALLLWADPVSAQDPITVSTNAPIPLQVNGRQTTELPSTVPPGSRVCVTKSLHYLTESDRWSFQGWSHGSIDPCITLTEPGAYQAVYTHEVLLHIRSTASQVRKSMWVPLGKPVALEAPATVQEGAGVRYRFQEWSAGETPFSPSNVIAPLSPSEVEVKWAKEYLVTVEGPAGVSLQGPGWYPRGYSLTIRAPDVIDGANEGERMKFSSWDSIGPSILVLSNPGSPTTTFNVDAPYALRAAYEKQYLVIATAPFGTLKREWVKEGEEVLLQTPAVQEIVPGEERLVFKRWEGQEGLTSPTVSGLVEAPVNLSAVYERQVMVKVDAPFGASGNGWHTVGSSVTISVPDSKQSNLVFKESFEGFPGYSRDESTIELLVREPTVVTALYSTGVNIGILVLFLLLPLLAVLIYLAYRWILPLVRQRAQQERSP